MQGTVMRVQKHSSGLIRGRLRCEDNAGTLTFSSSVKVGPGDLVEFDTPANDVAQVQRILKRQPDGGYR